MEYLTVVNASTTQTMYTVNNNGAHARELYNPGGESPANGFLPTALCQRFANGFFSQRLFLTTASERVVTSAAAADGSSVFLTTVLPYAELMAQKPPLYRDRESQLDMALPARARTGTHQLRVQLAASSCYSCTVGQAYVATPVFQLANGVDRVPGASPVAFIVAGIILTGKAAVTSSISRTLGGFSGL
eukprot:10709-Heterococcus_DN1.PRE.1